MSYTVFSDEEMKELLKERTKKKIIEKMDELLEEKIDEFIEENFDLGAYVPELLQSFMESEEGREKAKSFIEDCARDYYDNYDISEEISDFFKSKGTEYFDSLFSDEASRKKFMNLLIDNVNMGDVADNLTDELSDFLKDNLLKK